MLNVVIYNSQHFLFTDGVTVVLYNVMQIFNIMPEITVGQVHFILIQSISNAKRFYFSLKKSSYRNRHFNYFISCKILHKTEMRVNVSGIFFLRQQGFGVHLNQTKHNFELLLKRIGCLQKMRWKE